MLQLIMGPAGSAAGQLTRILHQPNDTYAVDFCQQTRKNCFTGFINRNSLSPVLFYPDSSGFSLSVAWFSLKR